MPAVAIEKKKRNASTHACTIRAAAVDATASGCVRAGTGVSVHPRPCLGALEHSAVCFFPRASKDVVKQTRLRRPMSRSVECAPELISSCTRVGAPEVFLSRFSLAKYPRLLLFLSESPRERPFANEVVYVVSRVPVIDDDAHVCGGPCRLPLRSGRVPSERRLQGTFPGLVVV